MLLKSSRRPETTISAREIVDGEGKQKCDPPIRQAGDVLVFSRFSNAESRVDRIDMTARIKRSPGDTQGYGTEKTVRESYVDTQATGTKMLLSLLECFGFFSLCFAFVSN
ncbi:hypothetical protein GWI33_005741 [Rhynchophorus ferrugineus]|uniref:Uncharacterized protein n=1 Tax=Rhynchophorus ferrugineus TaxID=354439 RepID=A0A834IME9_RHYFE|nr:hypothetical protein GWI33_005741 [Rhynchophorus ferrugineus]